jgi:hypothetical protein
LYEVNESPFFVTVTSGTDGIGDDERRAFNAARIPNIG